MPKNSIIWFALFAVPILYHLARSSPFPVVSSIVMHWVLAGAVLTWSIKSLEGPEEIGLHQVAKRFIVFVMIIAGLCTALITCFANIPLGDWQWHMNPLYKFGRWGVIIIAITAGFCEELIYRGYMMNALKRAGQPAWVAMSLSSLSFVFFHGLLPIAFLVVGFILSMAWAAIYHHTKNLWVVVYIHAVWDAVVMLVPWGSL